MNDKLQHATITLQHSYSAPLERVFSDFADPVARARWSAPSNDVLIYDEADFRIGGKDVFRCGPKGDPKFRGETRYLDIVPNARVVSSETVDVGNDRLAVALTTLDFEPTEDGTNLTVTIQVVSFVGPDMIHSYESGNKSALKNLSQHLSNVPAARHLRFSIYLFKQARVVPIPLRRSSGCCWTSCPFVFQAH
jgi:uncharacterized protein YndB with AHSA1/START domain